MTMTQQSARIQANRLAKPIASFRHRAAALPVLAAALVAGFSSPRPRSRSSTTTSTLSAPSAP